MKILNIFFYLIIVCQIYLTSCKNENDRSGAVQAEIQAEIVNLPIGITIYLSKVDVSGPKAIDSVKADELGKFNLIAPANEENLFLLLVGEKRLPVFLEAGKHSLIGDYNSLPGSFSYSNSPLTEMLKRVEAIRQDFDVKSRALQEEFQMAMMGRNKEKAASIEKSFTILLKSNKGQIKHIIDSIGPSPVSHLATSMLSVDEDLGYLDSLANRFEKEKPKAIYTQKILKYLEIPRKLGIGKEAPDFSLPDPNGKQIKLSEFRGNWVLLDFWASWCKPCRAENPGLVATYNLFKAKGFKILSVSLDADKSAWMKAVVTDKLYWAHSSDLKGWDNVAATLYGISSIPASFLIDPNGKIRARNLHQEELAVKLKEVMN